MKLDPAARFENIVALSLLKKLHQGQDLRGERSQLFYVRDKEKREADFLTVIDGKSHDLVEAKLSDSKLAPHLRYFAEKLKPLQTVQVVYHLNRDLTEQKIPIRKAVSWLEEQG